MKPSTLPAPRGVPPMKQEDADVRRAVLHVLASASRAQPITTDALRRRLRFTPWIIGQVGGVQLGRVLKDLHGCWLIREVHDDL